MQGNVLPAGLDLGSISALAAALGVQGVSLPGRHNPLYFHPTLST